MPYYHINNNLNKAQNINDNLNSFVINYFYKLLNNNKDYVIAISLLICQNQQTCDKIYQ